MTEPTAETSDIPVTVVISRRVKPGKEAEFEAFLAGVNAACMQYEGHLGANIFRPSNSASSEYRIIFKFDSLNNLRRWEASEERQQWFSLAEELTQSPPQIQILTGLETWFTLPGQSTITPPPRYKMALVSWLAVFPLITTISMLLKDELNSLPIAVRTLIVTTIAIPTMTYIFMPRMTQLFAAWLYPNSTYPSEAPSDKSNPVLPAADAPTVTLPSYLENGKEIEMEARKSSLPPLMP
ncbi:antibiotic biosynthesis monooxygenase [Kovacikia minuta CCNUW1]|uniref:antibiotic biosynthesis monooxygenase n=1 Tax=Kovacikia minuta TaxID=2931930 RepID=UPI001CCA5D2E|nr:antibiotic biosynthesis monooxygenase [Kovacikia minuta]UBF26979.1 antibiotic biosynthesis monooxygenase [Kovacikia minuta CCNUW1]